MEENLIELETLYLKYDNLLTLYNQNMIEYTELVTISNTHDESDIDKGVDSEVTEFNVIKNNEIVSTDELSRLQNINSVADCKEQCSTTDSCNAANYYSSNECRLFTGNNIHLKTLIYDITDDEIVDDEITDDEITYVIIKKSKFLLMKIKKINEELVNTSNSILEYLNKSEQKYSDTSIDRYHNDDELKNKVQKLTEERQFVDNLIKKYNELSNSKKESSKLLNKQYFSFLSICLIMILTMYIIYKFRK